MLDRYPYSILLQKQGKLKLMAHEDVLVSVGAEGCLLLDDGVGDVLVTEDVVLVLAGRVYLVLVTPVALAVLRVGTNIIIQSNSILILSF